MNNRLVRLLITLVFLTGLFTPAVPASAIQAEPASQAATVVALPQAQGGESISGSFVITDPNSAPGCYDSTDYETVCFQADTYTDDWEYSQYLFLRFPDEFWIDDIVVSGTPTCDEGGSYGSFSWSYVADNEVSILHPRYHHNPTDHCRAVYCVSLTTGTLRGPALVSWYYKGDGYNGNPHYVCSSDNYTPAGQPTCEEAVEPQAVYPECWKPDTPDPLDFTRFDCVWYDDGSAPSEYNRKVYCPGGRNGSATEDPTIWQWNPLPDPGTWADTGDDVYEDVSNYTAVLLKDENFAEKGLGIYLIGGSNSEVDLRVNYVQRYYPKVGGNAELVTTDPWPGLSGANITIPGACVNTPDYTKAYCFGGYDPDAPPYNTAATYEYDPLRAPGQRWQRIATADLSLARGYIQGAVFNGMIYAMGGDTYDGLGFTPTSTAEALDLANPAAGWQPIADLPVAVSQGRAFSMEVDTLEGGPGSGSVFVVGGTEVWSGQTSRVHRYSVSAGTWEADYGKLISARRNQAGVYIPLCTENPFDGYPGFWVLGGRIVSDEPPFGEPEYYSLNCLGDPVMYLEAPPLEATLEPGDEATIPITICNTGANPLNFDIEEVKNPPMKPVALLQDQNPWGYESNQEVLAKYGIPYEIHGSTEFASLDFSQFSMIIVASVQPISFYDAVTANLSQFEDYVAQGGNLLFFTALYGDDLVALPGEVSPHLRLDTQNTVVAIGHPIVEGVPNPFHGNYASHTYFTNIPYDALVIATDTLGPDPTLLEYKLGAGWVVAAGQPLEFAYMQPVGPNWDFPMMLENTILHGLWLSNLQWLEVNPVNGSVEPEQCVSPVVTLDSLYQAQGVYTASLEIFSNDLMVNPVILPVTMTVAGPDLTAGPLVFHQVVGPDTQTQASLVLENSGNRPLEWSLVEALNGLEANGLLPDPASTDFDPAPLMTPLSPAAVGTEMFRLELGTKANDFQLLGVEFLEGNFLVTGGNSNNDPNKLYKFNQYGNRLGTYELPPECAGWGGRDLATDGYFLYFGCDDGLIHRMDQWGYDYSPIPGPGLVVPRAMAYDPATGHLWTANFASDLYEIALDGTIINTFPSLGLSIYGLAWDDVSPGGPFLWAWSQDGIPPVLASQIDPATGTLTGLSFMGSDLNPGYDNLAGGAAIVKDLVANQLVFVGLHQAQEDTLVVYDLDFQHACLPDDLAWVSLDQESGVMPAGTVDTVQVNYDSTGLVNGIYTGTICLLSNDPATPSQPLNMTLVVTDTPDISVDPLAISAQLVPSTTLVVPVEICNLGTLPLTYTLQEAYTPTLPRLQLPGPVASPGGQSTTLEGLASVGVSHDHVPVAAENSTQADPAVAILMDDAPWGFNSIESILDDWGVAYDIVNSTSFATINFSKYQMVIFSGGQSTAFYDAYAASQDRFEAYVEGGGYLIFSTADNWIGFFLHQLPGGVGYVFDPAIYIVSINPSHPIMQGLPAFPIGNWGSHGYFTNLPPYALRLALNQENGGVALVEYPLGKGMVLATTLPWEHAYHHDFSSGGALVNALAYGLDYETIDLPWLSAAPITGTLATGDCETIAVTLDSTGLPAGGYGGFLLVHSNDLDEPEVAIDVTLIVGYHRVYMPLVIR